MTDAIQQLLLKPERLLYPKAGVEATLEYASSNARRPIQSEPIKKVLQYLHNVNNNFIDIKIDKKHII